MDEWIVAACSALRFFKFMQSIFKKTTPNSQLGMQKRQGARAFENKKSLQISGFGQNNTKSHLEQKNFFFAKKFLKKAFVSFLHSH